jgi:hypothetical protein
MLSCWFLDVASNFCNNGGPEGDIWDEMAVHYVYMQPLGNLVISSCLNKAEYTPDMVQDISIASRRKYNNHEPAWKEIIYRLWKYSHQLLAQLYLSKLSQARRSLPRGWTVQ